MKKATTSGQFSAARTDAVEPECRGAAALLRKQPDRPAGFWSVSGKYTPDGKPVQLSGTNPAEVKGWMTIQAALDAYAVDQDALYTAFAIPAEVPPSTPLKDLETRAPDFSVTALRTWLTAQVTP